MLMENDAFLLELGRLFQRSRSSSNVLRIAMKRYDGKNKPSPRSAGDGPHHTDYKCLFRASQGSGKKISTVVNAKDVNKFQLAYFNVLKSNMDSLKKRDKKADKDKKPKSKAAA